MAPLFVYGTLLFPEILEVVLGRVPDFKDGILSDYHRFNIHDGINTRLYPAISNQPGGLVEGRLLLDLSYDERQVLDAYEGREYFKKTVQVQCEGQLVEAEVYIWHTAGKDLLKGSWSPSNFKIHHLDQYVRDLKGYT